jgi:hypothetical protein
MSGKTYTQPEAPEHQPEVDYDSEADNNDLPEQSGYDIESSDSFEETREGDLPDNVSEEHEHAHLDEYGNDTPAPKTYTEAEVNERINKAVRERLARGNHEQVPQQQVTQQAQANFEYNPESNDSWQTQLEQFVESTVDRMSQKRQQAQLQQQEKQAQVAFEEKMYQGMGRFSDFTDVVSGKPISDAMVMATRGMEDPAAFIYAASKRAPQELERIAKISDPYSQMMEMGKLEERMRKTKPGTNAPKPIGRTPEDTTNNAKPKSKEPTIEDLIARSDAKRRAQLNAKRGRN